MCVSWGWGLGLIGRCGIKVGRYIYILLLLIWHIYFIFFVCTLYSVSCPNYMYYVCEILKLLKNVVKHSGFVYTRE